MAKATPKTAAKIIDRKAVLTVTPAAGKAAVLAIAKAANLHSGADATVLESLAKNVRAFGPMTGEQWDAYVKALLLDALKAQPKVTNPDNYVSKFKTAGLAIASGLPEFKPAFGQTLNAYLDVVREPLKTATLPDGRTVFPVRADGKPAGKGRKPMSKAAKAKAKAERETAKAVETLSASKADDAGHDVSRRHALAVSLMGTEASGSLLIWVLENDAAAFVLWAKDRQAKAVDTSKTAPKPKAPKPEPDAKDVALNKELLAMANKTATPPDKTNGAAH
jgi:hypothetical protein